MSKTQDQDLSLKDPSLEVETIETMAEQAPVETPASQADEPDLSEPAGYRVVFACTASPEAPAKEPEPSS